MSKMTKTGCGGGDDGPSLVGACRSEVIGRRRRRPPLGAGTCSAGHWEGKPRAPGTGPAVGAATSPGLGGGDWVVALGIQAGGPRAMARLGCLIECISGLSSLQ